MRESKVAEAYERCRPVREELAKLDAVLMEVTEDKAGIVWQRWYLQTSKPLEVQGRTVNIIVFSTPHWYDVFTPIADTAYLADTIAALRALVNT